MSSPLFVKLPCVYTSVGSLTESTASVAGESLECRGDLHGPLWEPQLYPELFSDARLLCEWIRHELSLVHGDWVVEAGISEVVVYSVMGWCSPFSITFDDIASASFYPRHVLARIGDGAGTPLSVSSSFSSPLWLYSSRMHYVASLAMLSVKDLREAASRLGCVIPERRRKVDYCASLIDHVQVFKQSVMERNNQGLSLFCSLLTDRSSLSSIPAGVLLSRRTMISYIFDRYFGSRIATHLRIPEGQVSYSHLVRVDQNDTVKELFGHISAANQAAVLRKMSSSTLTQSLKALHPARLVLDSAGAMSSDVPAMLVESFLHRCAELGNASNTNLREILYCWDPFFVFDGRQSRIDCVKLVLAHEYGESVATTLLSLRSRFYIKNRRQREWLAVQNAENGYLMQRDQADCDSSWPQIVPRHVVHACLNDYIQGMKWENPPVCAVCARSKSMVQYVQIHSDSREFSLLRWRLLYVVNPNLASIMSAGGDTRFWDIPVLDHLMLHHAGIHRNADNSFTVDMCDKCNGSLLAGSMPRFALANDLYRGELPAEFADLTWVEERVCAKHLATIVVTRLLLGHGRHRSLALRGNTCAHEINIVSTARALPRAPADVNDMLSVVFIGPLKPDSQRLEPIFYVRRRKVWRFLMWLKDNNELYSDISIDPEIVKMYPESGILPGLMDRVIFNEATAERTAEIYDEETAGLPEHASEALFGEDVDMSAQELFLEKTGVSDAEIRSLPPRFPMASALRNLIPSKDRISAGIQIRKGGMPLSEYKNPSLIPGMFPTLFPYGIGGFEEPKRLTRISFANQAEYYLDLSDRRFRYHGTFMFVLLNIIQRRTGHLYTSFTVSRQNFQEVADAFAGLSHETIHRLADVVEKEVRPQTLSEEEKTALLMLRYVNTIATKVPGSAASKTLCRNEIRSYIGIMGAPQVFLTINPSPQHHPVFQLMFGDHTVNLNERYPQLVPGPERAKRLAKDPVAAADFFFLSIRCVFEHLFGWDFRKGQSTDRGGILGQLMGWYGTAEYTERAVLHGHFLLWFQGGLNPSEVHKKMREDESFRERFFTFFEDIIKHDLPEVDVPPGFNPKTWIPATELPLDPLPLNEEDIVGDVQEIATWEDAFDTEVRMCGETLQRHSCKKVCFKYGKGDRCRFRFPHELVEASYFDADSNAIYLVCRDATLNYYNPHILVYCRHNHDIRCIMSGKSAKAAMFYITDYITKMSLKTSQMLSLMCEAVMATPGQVDGDSVAHAKNLLHKCLSQFSKKQQIHSQQAVRYLRRLGDSMSSHKTVPIMSNIVVGYLHNKYKDRLIGVVNDAMDIDSDIGSQKGARSETNGDPSGEDSDDYSLADPIEELGQSVVDMDLDEQTSPNHIINDNLEDNEYEQMRLEMRATDSGRIVNANQLHDYLYRDDLLSDLSFLDFVCLFKLERKTGREPIVRERVRDRYRLKAGHPLASSHRIVQRFLVDETAPRKIYSIPRIVGMSIPRSSRTELYSVFLLGHFVPFDDISGPLPDGFTVEQFVGQYQFSDDDKRLIDNWQVIWECEDARDADRLAEQERSMQESRRIREGLQQQFDDDEDGIEISGGVATDTTYDESVIRVLRKLRYAKYLTGGQIIRDDSMDTRSDAPDLFTSATDHDSMFQAAPASVARWDREIKIQQSSIESSRNNLLNLQDQYPTAESSANLPDTEVGETSGKDNTVSSGDSETDSTSYEDEMCRNSGVEQDWTRYFQGSTSISLGEVVTAVSKTPSEVVEDLRVKHSLNEKQFAAFIIAANAWFEVYRRRVQGISVDDSGSDREPLRLLMTGPGGTGKSHSIKALRDFMEYYGSGHRLRLLAPTGSAASLIDGMTCHKGLSLRIKKKGDGRRDIQRTSFNEMYELETTVQKKSEMRDAWRNVDVVLIDEVSLLSLQALTEIDHALRMAKEKPDEWFGGIIVIFSGDFCQYPPVGGHALFTAIRSRKRMTVSELKKRLGRLAWKTLNAVVEFTEQYRMREDPEYAMAVNRLRVRSCTDEDVALFNSRAIRSVHNRGGIDMSLEDHGSATMIVATNDLRERVNQLKAESVCEVEGHTLHACYSLDYIGDGERRVIVPKNEYGNFREAVIRLRTAAHSAEGALPGLLSFYEGMPVILRGRNLAVDLRIANGSQGFIHKICLDVDEYGYTYAKFALVYFPGSPVKLSGLPQGVFLIKPVTWTFYTPLELEPGSPVRCRVRRQQLPIQPGFCVTGHSAQGKTLPKVLCGLSEGSWAAYVSVSRARRRGDLYLLHPVTKDQLNRKLPFNLVNEMKRFKAMEHNTLVKYGFLSGTLVEVPDVEDAYYRPHSGMFVGDSAALAWSGPISDMPSTHPEEYAVRTSVGSTSECGDEGMNIDDDDNDVLDIVIPEVSFVTENNCQDGIPDVHEQGDSQLERELDEEPESERLQGCSWNARDWSCAYDCVFMLLWNIYENVGDQWRREFAGYNACTKMLVDLFENLGSIGQPIRATRVMEVNSARDLLRDHVSSIDEVCFPRNGAIGTSAQELLSSIMASSRWDLGLFVNDAYGSNDISERLRLRDSMWLDLYELDAPTGPLRSRHTHQCWVIGSCTLNNTLMWPEVHDHRCLSAEQTPFKVSDPPCILYLNHTASMRDSVLAVSLLRIPVISGIAQYRLCGVLYYGGNHFTARLFRDGATYQYDSQSFGGAFVQEFEFDAASMTTGQISSLSKMGDRHAHTFVYVRLW